MRFVRGSVDARGLRRGLFCAIVVGVLISGCGEPDPRPLRVGILVWPAYEMPFLARSLGAFDGKPVELVEFYSPAETLMAYNSGSLDVIALTTHYALQLAAQDPGQRVIMVSNVSDGADALLARPEIDSLPDIRGKRVGVERSALGAYMLQRALDMAGLGPGDITIVSTDISEGPDAYARGDIDVVVTYEPYRTAILNRGARELFSSRDLPGGIVDVVITKQTVIDAQSAAVGALVEGWLRAIAVFESDPPAHAPPLARREKLTVDEFLATFEGIALAGRDMNRTWFKGAAPQLETQLRSDAEVLRRAGFLEDSFDYSTLMDGRFVSEKAEP